MRGGWYRDLDRAITTEMVGSQIWDILEIELIRFPDGLDVGHKRKKRVNHNTKRFMACAVRRMKLS